MRRRTPPRLARAIQFAGCLPAPLFFASTFCFGASQTFDVQLDQTKFGHIDQANVPGLGAGSAGANSCAPTATMNSFQFLNTAYPQVYGTNPSNGNNPTLMGNSTSWTGAAINLAQSYMMTTNASGTLETNWINGKRNYLEALAPGKTTYAGMDSVSTGGQAWVQNANPTATFLYNELKDGEDIEIGMSPPGPGIGHVMTLTSIHWVDADGSNTFNAGDALSLDGIDPAGGAAFNVNMTPGNPMTFNGGVYNGYVLDAALAESPLPSLVPEPAALGLALSWYGVIGSRRRRRAMDQTG